MIGHAEVIEMRKQGYKPKTVFVVDFGEPPRDFYNAAENIMALGGLPEIHISPSDDVARLDMRFLVGVAVCISSGDKERARGLYGAVKRAMPASIAVSVGDLLHHEVFNG